MRVERRKRNAEKAEWKWGPCTTGEGTEGERRERPHGRSGRASSRLGEAEEGRGRRGRGKREEASERKHVRLCVALGEAKILGYPPPTPVRSAKSAHSAALPVRLWNINLQHYRLGEDASHRLSISPSSFSFPAPHRVHTYTNANTHTHTHSLRRRFMHTLAYSTHCIQASHPHTQPLALLLIDVATGV